MSRSTDIPTDGEGYTVDREQWKRIISWTEPPTYHEVAQTLVDELDLATGQVYRLIDNALDDGRLVERTTTGSFPYIQVPTVSKENRTVLPVRSQTVLDLNQPGALSEASLTESDKDGRVGASDDITDTNGGGGAGNAKYKITDSNGDGADATDPEPQLWARVDFTAPESDTWPAAWTDREFWMACKGKKPYAPWGDRNNPNGVCRTRSTMPIRPPSVPGATRGFIGRSRTTGRTRRL